MLNKTTLNLPTELSYARGWTDALSSAPSSTGVVRADYGPLDFILRHGAKACAGGDRYLEGFLAARTWRNRAERCVGISTSN